MRLSALASAAALTAGAAVALVAVPTTASALQPVAQDRVVSPMPASFTPDVLDGRVQAIVQAGNKIVLGGTFTQAENAGSSTTLTRTSLLAFDKSTGIIDPNFHPTLDGDVNALAVTPDGTAVYVGGGFNNVNGVRSKSLAELNVSTGQAVTGFKVPAIDAVVQDLKLNNGTLYIAGFFANVGGQARSCLAALNPTTGAVLPNINVSFAGTSNGGVTQVYKIDVNPDGTRMVVLGNFATINGLDRMQIGMIDLTTSPASVADWETDVFKPLCYSVFEFYVRDVEFSPDGAYFVVGVTGGYGSGPPTFCDTVSRWETARSGSSLQPSWVDYTGGDTTYSVGVTGTAIYVGGHMRWENNPFAGDAPGPGAVAREGIGALDPVNGLPLAWNPGRDRGKGVFDFLATNDGLWVGSDTDYIGRYFYHAKIAFFPLAGGEVIPRPNPGALPGNVYQVGRLAPPGQSNVLYRINAGGPTMPAIDDGPDWQGDQSDPSPYRNSGSNSALWNSGISLNSSVPSTTPIGVFESERWDPSGDPEMQWALPVTAGTPIEVRLYFANNCGCTSQVGQRQFNVTLDGTPVLTNYDMVADVGNLTGTMKKWDITSDGTVNIDFGHVVENPLINAIEIVNLGPPPPPTNVFYRVNAGGPQLASLDNGPAWAGDQSDPSPYRNSGSNTADWGGIAHVAGTVPSSTPSAVFNTERWDPGDPPEMQWAFSVPSGTHVEVRLYFANQCSCTNTVGARQFDVSIDGTKVLDHYDIVADVGDQTGTMKAFDITSDGSVNIDFAHEVENPLINAIEIVDLDGPVPQPPPVDTNLATYRSFDGTTPGSNNTLSSSIQWSQVRGAFMLNGTLYTGWTDGNLYARTFNGSTFGSPVNVNTSDLIVPLAAWHADVQLATSMFYWQGRLYYTLKYDPNLYYRYFTPESKVVGAMRFTASGSVTGLDFGKVQGAFVNGNSLYWVNRDDGSLHRIGWQNGTVVDGTDTVVDSNNDWSGRGLFIYSPAGAPAPNLAPVASAQVTCSGTTCTATSLGSADQDPGGWLTSFAWNWGDGATSSGARSTHTYSGAGTFNVTLTVTDNSGATGANTVPVTITAPNQAPTASFTASCTSLTCSFDGSASSDPDGSIASYAWNFGDGANGSGATQSHTYAAAGSYTVTLTVTDNLGATANATKTVPVGTVAAISFVAKAELNTNATTHSVTVPSAVQAGDGLLLFFTMNSSTVTVTGPSGLTGWTQVGTVTNGSMVSTVWQKSAAASDAGKTVSLTASAFVKAHTLLLAYRGTAATPVASFASASDSSTATHVTPAVTATAGQWLVSYWGDKSAATTWTPPAGQTVRSNSIGSGSSHIDGLAADAGGPVSAGSQGSLTASTDSSGRAVMWSILLAPLA